ncbi:MAG TPA: hypothetical protein VGR71_05125 [Nitrospira sp.]|nr:hypothetical protein [Nitrospira sp.]
MTDSTAQTERSYGCTFACGNPYDYIFIDVRSGTTEFLCLPDFVRLASDIVNAVTDVDPATEAAWLKSMSPLAQTPMSGNGAKRGRKNAPATNDDPDLFEAFDSRIEVEDLPDEFK